MFRHSFHPILNALPLALVAAISLPACIEDEETIGSDQDELTNLDVIDVGYGRTRYMQEVCGRRCVRYSSEDYARGVIRVCLEWTDACGPLSQSVGLYEDDWHLQNSILFEEHPEAQYQGCGPKAAQNVLRYYGMNMSLDFVRSSMDTYEFPFTDNIATMPADLADGLQSLLDYYGDGDFDVQVHHDKGAQFAKGYLARGEPVILLVYSGDHYVTATGFNGASYHIIDYTGESRWESEADLGMDFEWEIPFTSYQSGTVITIEHSNPVCECKPGERQSCGANDDGRQYCQSDCSWNVCTHPNDDQIPPPPTLGLEYLGCSSSLNTFMAIVSPTGPVTVTSMVKQFRIGTGSWTTLVSPTIKAASKKSVGLRAKACNANGCSAYAYRSTAGPYCGLSGGGVAF